MSRFKKIKNWLFTNRSATQTVAKNTVWLVASQIISRVLRAGLVIYAARVLGAGSWGAFSYALAIITFLTTFSDFGVNAYLTKEIARDPSQKDRYLSTALFIKLGLLVILFSTIFLTRNYLTSIPEARALIPILIFVFAFDALRDFGSALMRAFERMEVEALLTLFTNLAIVIFGFIFLYSSPGAIPLAYAYTFGSILGFIATLIALRSHLRRVFSNFSGSLVKKILLSAWPFGLMTLLGVVMLNTDIIVIGWLRSAEDVGFYSAGQKLTQLLYVVPTLFASALFPQFARVAVPGQEERFRIRLEKSLGFALLIALPLTLGGLLLGDQITDLFFGLAYHPAAAVFQILSLTFLIVFPSIILSNALFARGERKEFVRAVTIGVFMNLIANLILIPPFGLVGAAFATIISQVSSNFFFWKKMKRAIAFQLTPYIKTSLVATLLMSIVIIVLRLSQTPIIANVAVGGLVYLGTLYAFREPLIIEIKKLFR